MKRLTLTLASIAALGLVACQRQAAPPRAEAVPSPSPVTDAAAPEATAPGDTLERPQVATAEAPAGRVDPATGVRVEQQEAPAPPPRRRAPAPPPSRPSAPARETRSEPAPEPAPVEEPRPAPRAETARVEQREEIVLPEGTELHVRLTEPVASDTSRPEDAVVAELVEAVRHEGRVVLPSGSEVIGSVVVAQQSGRVKGRARVVIGFHEVRVRNRSYDIDAARWDVSAESSKGRDAKIAGGAAAAGAVIGAITGGGKGALKGAMIGGAAGGAAVLVTRGNEVELPAGVVRKVVLRSPLRIQ